MRFLFLFSFILLFSHTAAAIEVTSNSGRFRLDFAFDPATARIDQLYDIPLKFSRVDGQAFAPREIRFQAEMPEHGHGLATQAQLKDDFVLRGVKFQMFGNWLFQFLIHDAEGTDVAMVAFHLGPRAIDAEMKKLLGSFSRKELPPLPDDTGNAVQDDPRAIALGARLFQEARLSAEAKFSCKSCHDPQKAFIDGRKTAQGHGLSSRNTPTLLGAAYSKWMFWDGRRDSLWSQALGSLENPLEMKGSRCAIAALMDDKSYRKEYQAIFGKGKKGDCNRAFTNVGKAIAAYVRSIKLENSRFDQYVEGEGGIELSASEQRGLKLFLSPDTQCTRCHNGPMFSNGSFANIGTQFNADGLPDFGRSIGIQALLSSEFNCRGPYNDKPKKGCPELDHLNRHHENAQQVGAFKVPSLRNVAATAPYMHDGRYQTLEEAVGHYKGGGKMGPNIEFRPFADMNPDQIQDLAAFLRLL